MSLFWKYVWEQRKAKALFMNISKKGSTNLPVLSVTQENGVILRDDLDIDVKYDKNSLTNYKIVNSGNFIISLRSFQGGFELSNLCGITSPAYTILALQHLKEHDKCFWKYFFKTNTFIESLKKVTFGIRDGRSISYQNFSTLKLKFPTKNEQVQIGELLSTLDSLIAANQRQQKKPWIRGPP
ncbi:restriction endonuclease subunit S [Pediococcus ethanolidurans]|uniref:restriction endonuclease subunit S n=1 Tax=Pediococcus ethanolidurans TaxID=319653 RepID=UPI00345C4017